MIAPIDYNPKIRSSDEISGEWREGDTLREFLKRGMEPNSHGMVQVRNEKEMNEIIDEMFSDGFAARSAFIGDRELGQWMIETVDGGEMGWSDDPANW